MKVRSCISGIIVSSLFFITSFKAGAHDIYFCGEKIPLTPRVAEKLMDIIRKQIRYNVVSSLKGRESEILRTIEMILEKKGYPDDLKYLAIVESGLRNVVSPVGAAGFWQIMPGTAKDLDLVISGGIDERNDLKRSTLEACRLLGNYFKEIKKKFGVSSWVLTAAAYNYGSGNMGREIKNQGKNYFAMDLNKETSEYVYKIIAVKELFEYPELYLKDFGYNIFNKQTAARLKNEPDNIDKSGFDALIITGTKGTITKNKNDKKPISPVKNNTVKQAYASAYVTGNYANFKDSTEIKFTLTSSLNIENSLKYPGKIITGIGWKIGDKIFVDFGYGKKLLVIDHKNKKHDGILETSLKDKYGISLQVTEFNN
ncbi:MAG: lytic transglycosylase domain-containing protein [Ferruginibacter sp.]